MKLYEFFPSCRRKPCSLQFASRLNSIEKHCLPPGRIQRMALLCEGAALTAGQAQGSLI